jgi:hypothetical protein
MLLFSRSRETRLGCDMRVSRTTGGRVATEVRLRQAHALEMALQAASLVFCKATFALISLAVTRVAANLASVPAAIFVCHLYPLRIALLRCV